MNPASADRKLSRWIAYSQGAYFAVTGLWPILHIRSFEAITGEKTDDWLVVTVGALVLVIGIALSLAATRNRVTLELGIFAAGSAFALMMIDIIYVARAVISPIYLGDAAIELILLIMWSVAAFRGTAGRAPHT